MTGERESVGRALGSAMVALAGARLASVIALFAVGVIAARLLTPSAMGVAGVGQTIGWMVAIAANGGLNISAIYFLGQVRGTHPGDHPGNHSGDLPQGRPALVGRLVGLGLAAVGCAIVLAALVGPAVGVAALPRQIPVLFAAAAALAAATVGHELSGALLLGLERRRAYVVADLLRSVSSLGATAVLLLAVSRTAESYVAALAVGVACPAVFSLLMVRRSVGSIRPRYEGGFTRRALRFGLAGQAGNVLTFLNLRLDLLLVPALLRLDAAGIYFVATRVSEVVGQASTASASMLFPHVAGQPEGRATAVTERTSRLTLLATLAGGCVLAVLAGPLLGTFFGEVYRTGTATLWILLVAMLPLAFGRVLAADLKGRGRPGLVSIGSAVGAGLTVLADVALIPPLGITGAALASVLAYATMAGVLFGFYRRVTGQGLAPLLPRPADCADLARLAREYVRRLRDRRDNRATVNSGA